MSVRLLLLALLYRALLADNGRRERRFSPFIYPGGSVIQFALGMALPADVKGRNVATNSGILINIDLPTNLSQLRPPSRSTRSVGDQSALIAQLAALLGLSGRGRGECFVELECYRRRLTRDNTLHAELIVAILGSVLYNDGETYYGNGNTTSVPPSCERLAACDSPFAKLIRNIIGIYTYREKY